MSHSILQRIAAGEASALDDCMQQYGGLIWSLARRFSGNAGEVEDAVQEIFLDIWQNAARYDPRLGAETTYITMLARRRLIDRYRKRRRTLDTTTMPAAIDVAAPALPDRVELSDEVQRARRSMARLRPQEQQVLQLLVEGMSQSEIAEAIQLPLGTVKTHARRGMIRLRQMLGVASADNSSEAAGPSEAVGHPEAARPADGSAAADAAGNSSGTYS